MDEMHAQVSQALMTISGVHAVSLGGSLATGMADGASDSDVYAWISGALAPAPTREQALAPLADGGVVHSFDSFGPENHLHIDGRLVEVMYFDLDEFTRDIDRAFTEGLTGEVCTTAFLHTVAVSVVLADPGGRLAAARERLATYPEATRTRLLVDVPLMANEFLKQLRTAQPRADWPMVVRRRAALLDAYFTLLFAVNRRYHPGEKRLLLHADACPLQPEAQRERLTSVCLAAPDDEALPGALSALIEDVVALASDESPSGEHSVDRSVR